MKLVFKKLTLLALVATIAALVMFDTGIAEAATICVKPGGTSGCYATIQAAVNAAPSGSTINVNDGVYVEQVTITRNLTLNGSYLSTIKAPAAMTSNMPNNRRAVVAVNNATVSLTKFVVDGNNSGNNNAGLVGIAFINAAGKITNSTVKNAGYGTLSGIQEGLAIYARSDSGPVRSILIENNDVFGYNKNGITVVGAGISAQILNNRVTGAGPTPVLAQNGIQLSSGATGIIKTNTVKNHVYNGPYAASYSSSGILGYDTGAGVIYGSNGVSNSQLGVVAYGDSSKVEHNDIVGPTTNAAAFYGADISGKNNLVSENIFSKMEFGIYVEGDALNTKLVANEFHSVKTWVADFGVGTKIIRQTLQPVV